MTKMGILRIHEWGCECCLTISTKLTRLISRCSCIPACQREINYRTLIGIRMTRNTVISTIQNTSSTWRPICSISGLASHGQHLGSLSLLLHFTGVLSDRGHSKTSGTTTAEYPCVIQGKRILQTCNSVKMHSPIPFQ